MKREPCRYCRLPLATERDVASAYSEPGLCWSIVDYCDTDAETAIDTHLATIAQLERELEQERQDRKQADLDTIRALGERNDARAELAKLKATLADPGEVELAMIRGDIAIPDRVEFDGIRETKNQPETDDDQARDPA